MFMKCVPKDMGASILRGRSPWLITPRVVCKPRLRLFCFPFAGGNAVFFHKWSTKLPTDVELIAIQYPGHGTRIREPVFRNLGNLLAGALEAIAIQLEVKFVFFGHSMGATVAFELARRLRDRRLPLPTRLFLSSRGAPQLPEINVPRHKFSEAELLGLARTLGGIPAEVMKSPDLLTLLLCGLRADLEAIETWTYHESQPLEIPISLFGGLQDPEVPWERMEPWAQQTRSQVNKHPFPGGHFYLQEHFTTVLDIILREVGMNGIESGLPY